MNQSNANIHHGNELSDAELALVQGGFLGGIFNFVNDAIRRLKDLVKCLPLKY